MQILYYYLKFINQILCKQCDKSTEWHRLHIEQGEEGQRQH